MRTNCDCVFRCRLSEWWRSKSGGTPFRRVDIAATCPADIYPDRALLDAQRNADFLRQCVLRLPAVNFADAGSGRIYLRMVAGSPEWVDPQALHNATAEPDTRTAILACAPHVFELRHESDAPRYLADQLGPGRVHTLGRWGEGS